MRAFSAVPLFLSIVACSSALAPEPEKGAKSIQNVGSISSAATSSSSATDNSSSNVVSRTSTSGEESDATASAGWSAADKDALHASCQSLTTSMSSEIKDATCSCYEGGVLKAFPSRSAARAGTDKVLDIFEQCLKGASSDSSGE